MAWSSNQSSTNSTLASLFSQQSELDKSESLLPQGQPLTPGHDGQSAYKSSSSESSFELSGFSTVTDPDENHNSELADPFNKVFYKVFPSERSTDIHFYSQRIFNMIISVLDKEFSTPGEDINKFLLKTHIDGQKCHINVNRADLTIVVTGPGHVNWKEKTFRKMSVNMFKQYEASVNLTVSQQNNPTVMSGNDSVNHTSASQTTEVVTALMDKIHSLQCEVTKLTKQVNKILCQAVETVTENVNVTQKGKGTNNVRTERQNLSENDATEEVISLTSTPAPGHGPTPNRFQETNSPRRNLSQAARSNPVTKQRSSQQPNKANKILLIGDSIINGINKQGLKDNVYKHGIPGARIETLLNEIEMYDLNQFSHAVIYVGGNDAASGTDIKQFEDLYIQLLTHIQHKSECKIILVNSCPRKDADTSAVNAVIRSLSSNYETELVDAYMYFHDKNNKLINKYLSKDSIHLSASGVRRLLGMINVQLGIVHDFAYCAYERPNNKRPSTRRHTPSSTQHVRRANLIYPGQGGRHAPCTKCGETNHKTEDCRHAERIQCHQCGYYGHKARLCGPQ